MKSKTKISKQAKRKTNLDLVKTISESKKSKSWLDVAAALSSPVKNRVALNLSEINKKAEEAKKEENQTVVQKEETKK